MSTPKRSLGSILGLVLLSVLSALVLGGGAFVGGAALAVRSAQKKARTFCDTVAVGEDVTATTDRAREAGLRILQSAAPGSAHGELLAYSSFMLHRYVCAVEHEQGKVVGKSLKDLD